MRLIFALAGSLALLMTSACSPLAAECSKAAECDELGERTEDQCTADYEKQQADSEADSDCAIVVEKRSAYYDCKSGLSCEERKNVENSACASLNSDLLGALVVNLKCAFK